MKKTFEMAKDRLMEHLVRVDLEKLSMIDLSAYASMLVQLRPLCDEEPDYYQRMADLLKAGCCGMKSPSVPLKEV